MDNTKHEKLVKKHNIIGIISIIVAIFTIMIFVGVFMTKNIDKVVIQFGDHKIKSVEYKRLINQAQEVGLNSKQAHDVLVESVKSQAAAQRIGIKKEIYMQAASAMGEREAGRSMQNVGEQTFYERSKYKEAIENYLSFKEEGGYRVAFVNMPFSRYINGPSVGNYREDISKPITEEEAAKIKEEAKKDIDYVDKKSKEIYENVKNNNLPIEKAIQIVKNDDKMVYGGAANDSRIVTIPLSGSIDRGNNHVEMFDETLIDELSGYQVGQISELKEVTGISSNGLHPEELQRSEDLIKIGYGFMKLVDKSEPKPGIKNEFKMAIEELGK